MISCQYDERYLLHHSIYCYRSLGFKIFQKEDNILLFLRFHNSYFLCTLLLKSLGIQKTSRGNSEAWKFWCSARKNLNPIYDLSVPTWVDTVLEFLVLQTRLFNETVYVPEQKNVLVPVREQEEKSRDTHLCSRTVSQLTWRSPGSISLVKWIPASSSYLLLLGISNLILHIPLIRSFG